MSDPLPEGILQEDVEPAERRLVAQKTPNPYRFSHSNALVAKTGPAGGQWDVFEDTDPRTRTNSGDVKGKPLTYELRCRVMNLINACANGKRYRNVDIARLLNISAATVAVLRAAQLDQSAPASTRLLSIRDILKRTPVALVTAPDDAGCVARTEEEVADADAGSLKMSLRWKQNTPGQDLFRTSGFNHGELETGDVFHHAGDIPTQHARVYVCEGHLLKYVDESGSGPGPPESVVWVEGRFPPPGYYTIVDARCVRVHTPRHHTDVEVENHMVETRVGIPRPGKQGGFRWCRMTESQKQLCTRIAVENPNWTVVEICKRLKDTCPGLNVSESTVWRAMRNSNLQMMRAKMKDPRAVGTSAHKAELASFQSEQLLGDDGMFAVKDLFFMDETIVYLNEVSDRAWGTKAAPAETRRLKNKTQTIGLYAGIGLVGESFPPTHSLSGSVPLDMEYTTPRGNHFDLETFRETGKWETASRPPKFALFWWLRPPVHQETRLSKFITPEDIKDPSCRLWGPVEHAPAAPSHWYATTASSHGEPPAATTANTDDDQLEIAVQDSLAPERNSDFVYVAERLGTGDRPVLLSRFSVEFCIVHFIKGGTVHMPLLLVGGQGTAVEKIIQLYLTQIRRVLHTPGATSWESAEAFHRVFDTETDALQNYTKTYTPFDFLQNETTDDSALEPFLNFASAGMRTVDSHTLLFWNGIEYRDVDSDGNLVSQTFSERASRAVPVIISGADATNLFRQFQTLVRYSRESPLPVDPFPAHIPRSYFTSTGRQRKGGTLSSERGDRTTFLQYLKYASEYYKQNFPPSVHGNLRMAWDSAPTHGKVNITEKKKSFIHAWVEQVLGIRGAIFLPVRDPEKNPVELLFSFVKGVIRRQMIDLTGAASVGHMVALIDTAFSQVTETMIGKWLQYGCYQVGGSVKSRHCPQQPLSTSFLWKLTLKHILRRCGKRLTVDDVGAMFRNESHTAWTAIERRRCHVERMRRLATCKTVADAFEHLRTQNGDGVTPSSLRVHRGESIVDFDYTSSLAFRHGPPVNAAPFLTSVDVHNYFSSARVPLAGYDIGLAVDDLHRPHPDDSVGIGKDTGTLRLRVDGELRSFANPRELDFRLQLQDSITATNHESFNVCTFDSAIKFLQSMDTGDDLQCLAHFIRVQGSRAQPSRNAGDFGGRGLVALCESTGGIVSEIHELASGRSGYMEPLKKAYEAALHVVRAHVRLLDPAMGPADSLLDAYEPVVDKYTRTVVLIPGSRSHAHISFRVPPSSLVYKTTFTCVPPLAQPLPTLQPEETVSVRLDAEHRILFTLHTHMYTLRNKRLAAYEPDTTPTAWPTPEVICDLLSTTPYAQCTATHAADPIPQFALAVVALKAYEYELPRYTSHTARIVHYASTHVHALLPLEAAAAARQRAWEDFEKACMTSLRTLTRQAPPGASAANASDIVAGVPSMRAEDQAPMFSAHSERKKRRASRHLQGTASGDGSVRRWPGYPVENVNLEEYKTVLRGEAFPEAVVGVQSVSIRGSQSNEDILRCSILFENQQVERVNWLKRQRKPSKESVPLWKSTFGVNSGGNQRTFFTALQRYEERLAQTELYSNWKDTTAVRGGGVFKYSRSLDTYDNLLFFREQDRVVFPPFGDSFDRTTSTLLRGDGDYRVVLYKPSYFQGDSDTYAAAVPQFEFLENGNEGLLKIAGMDSLKQKKWKLRPHSSTHLTPVRFSKEGHARMRVHLPAASTASPPTYPESVVSHFLKTLSPGNYPRGAENVSRHVAVLAGMRSSVGGDTV